MKQLILTADDFGRTVAINAAIERAFCAGFLTQASLMVNEAAVDDATELARRYPELTVGLHLTLCAGRASQLSALTDASGRFSDSPARAGLRYFFSPKLAASLCDEIRAQFTRFRDLGFPPTYWDGHAHLHLHPTILRLTLPIAVEFGFRFTRLVRDPGPLAPLPAVFQTLSQSARPALESHGVQFADHVIGLRNSGRMDTATIACHLQNLPPGLSELYFHPGAEPEEADYTKLRSQLAASGAALTSTARLSPRPQTAR